MSALTAEESQIQRMVEDALTPLRKDIEKLKKELETVKFNVDRARQNAYSSGNRYT